MAAKITPVLEHPIDGFSCDPNSGKALAQVVEAHPALTPLLDFCVADPVQIALEIGMVSPHEEDGVDDLREIDFGLEEWFEASAGLAALGPMIRAMRQDPGSIAEIIYEPGLHAADVLADLEGIEQALLLARQHERRFHFIMQ